MWASIRQPSPWHSSCSRVGGGVEGVSAVVSHLDIGWHQRSRSVGSGGKLSLCGTNDERNAGNEWCLSLSECDEQDRRIECETKVNA